MPSVFFSYSHKDEDLRDQLEKHLSILKRQGIIETWHDRRIDAGQHVDHTIDTHIQKDEIILLLVSSDFLASDYCYNQEMTAALKRQQTGDAIVIPVILRACDWQHALFGRLNAVPRDGKPINQWPDIDQAFLQVEEAVRNAAENVTGNSRTVQQPPSRSFVSPGPELVAEPRSSNLRLTKTFTQRDKDRFQLDAFAFIARYFENSLAELEKRNPGYEGAFRRVDADRFFATIYLDGKDVARATIYNGGDIFNRGINYVQGETTQSNTMNEALTVQADDQTLYLSTMGMYFLVKERNAKLSMEGGAEFFWDIFIAPLQQEHRGRR